LTDDDAVAIRFSATVAKIQTMIDGGLRLTLDIGPIKPETIIQLIDARKPGVVLEVAAVAIKADKQDKW
jgi:hypothetical protein